MRPLGVQVFNAGLGSSLLDVLSLISSFVPGLGRILSLSSLPASLCEIVMVIVGREGIPFTLALLLYCWRS